MKLSEENQRRVDKLSEIFKISKDQVIDNIITDYRAREAAERLEFNIPGLLLEFGKIGDEVLTGDRLFVFLLTQYRMELSGKCYVSKEPGT